jgi:hypothetical protein
VIFHSYVSLPEGNSTTKGPCLFIFPNQICQHLTNRRLPEAPELRWPWLSCSLSRPRNHHPSGEINAREPPSSSDRSWRSARWYDQLVDGRPTPLKNRKVNWEDDIPNIWKNKIHVPNHQPVSTISISIWKDDPVSSVIWFLSQS